jgi:hypothetical protein
MIPRSFGSINACLGSRTLSTPSILAVPVVLGLIGGQEDSYNQNFSLSQ